MTTKEAVEAMLESGESVQLVGISGIGKSRLLQELGGIFMDASLLYPIDYLSLLTSLANKLGINTKSNNPVEIQKQILKTIDDKRLTLIIDGFEKIVKSEFTQFFDFLKSLRDICKPRVTFVFSISGVNPVGSPDNNVLGNLFRIVQENIIYLQPVSKNEIESSIESDKQLSSYVNGRTINFNNLYKQTGGIISLIKAKLKENDLLLNSQVSEIKKQIENAPIETLQKHGLADEHGQIISELLRNSISDKKNALTVLESSLFSVLKENINSVVSKDKICEAVYPEVKNKNGISDNSIDQLVYRLKKKLNDYSIVNQHGQGYKLIKS